MAAVLCAHPLGQKYGQRMRMNSRQLCVAVPLDCHSSGPPRPPPPPVAVGPTAARPPAPPPPAPPPRPPPCIVGLSLRAVELSSELFDAQMHHVGTPCGEQSCAPNLQKLVVETKGKRGGLTVVYRAGSAPTLIELLLNGVGKLCAVLCAVRWGLSAMRKN